MKKKSKVLLGILIFLLVAVGVVSAIYFVGFDRFVLVSDPAWSYLLPSSEIFSLRLTLAQKGYRLEIVDASASQLDEVSAFTPMLLALKASSEDVVFLGPLASSCAVRFEVDVSALLPNVVVLGLWKEACNNFDVTLVAEVDVGWLEAAKAARSGSLTKGSETQTMAQKVAVVYDFDGTSAFEAIKSVLAEDSLLPYYYDGESHLFASNSILSMQQEQVVLAMCPHLEGLYDLVSMDESVSWIVDYRYASIIPKSQLFGIVLPDLSGVMASCLGSDGLDKKAAGESSAVVMLNYKYKAK